MSPQIQIDEDVFKALTDQAIPFQDHEPNDVLRRLLLTGDDPKTITRSTEAPESAHASEAGTHDQSSRTPKRSKAGKRRRAASSTLLPETEYRYPILRALSDNGGRMPTREVVAAVGEFVKHRLLPADLEMLGRKPRWEGRVQFTRLQLIRDGLMKEGSPRGVWEITSAGEEAVNKQGQADKGATARTGRALAGAL